jgi:hypothetical protein
MGSILNSLILVDLGVPPLYETSTSIPLLRPALSLVSSPGHVFFTHDRSYLYHPRMDAYLKLDNIGWFGRVNECNTIVYFTWCIKEMHAVTFCIFWFWHDQHVRDTMEKKRLRIDGFMPSSVTSVWHRFATTVWPCTDGTVSRNFWSRGIRWSSHPWWWTPCQFVQKGLNIKPPIRIGIQHQPFH